MAYIKKLKIVDDTNTNLQLEVFINNVNRVLLNVGEISRDDSQENTGYITMDKQDVQALINELNELKELL